MRGKILNNFFRYKVVHKKTIITKKFLQKSKLTGFVIRNHIIENELEPFGYVHLEKRIFSDQLVYDLVESII